MNTSDKVIIAILLIPSGKKRFRIKKGIRFRIKGQLIVKCGQVLFTVHSLNLIEIL